MDEPSRKRLLLTRWLGSLAGLIQGDFLTRDRWLWLKARLPETANGETLLDVGCGAGAFTIAAALRGYHAVGLSWDRADLRVAVARAALCRADRASFQTGDARLLDQEHTFRERFDFAISCETIEHILDDRRVILALAGCLKPGGRLLLTAPHYHYRAIARGDCGPFETTELGWHVRRGYSRGQLLDLFHNSGLLVEDITYCSGWLSQKLTGFLRLFDGRPFLVGWCLTLPFRLLVPPVDRLLGPFHRYPAYSICVEAYKPRHGLQS